MQAGEAAGGVSVDQAFAVPVIVGMCLAWAASATVAAGLVGRLRRGQPVIEEHPHPPATWSGADVALVATVFVGLLVAAGNVLGSKPSLQRQLVADVVTKLGATLGGIAVLRSGGASWAALGWAGGWRDNLRVGLGGLALVLAPLLGIAAVLDRIVPYRHPVVDYLQTTRDPFAVALVGLAAVVVAPVAEEFFFRRVLQGWLEARLPEAGGAAAVGLSAAAFAAAHAGHGLAPAPLFLLGVALGIVARRTGSLVPCVILHAAFNAVGVGLILLAQRAGG